MNRIGNDDPPSKAPFSYDDSLARGGDFTGDFDDEDFIQQQMAILRQIQEEQGVHEIDDCKPPALSRDVDVRDYLGEDFLDNQDVIEEQQRILAEFERCKSTRTMSTVASTTTPSSLQHEITELDQECRQVALEAKISSGSVHSAGKSSALPGSSSRSGNSMHGSDDFYEHVSSRNKVRVKGTKHAYEAITQGKAILVQCPSCQALFQVPKKTKNLFCTICNQVSPAQLAQTGDDSSGIEDSRVASNMQWQEMDAKLFHGSNK